jgi:hypothetical protein
VRCAACSPSAIKFGVVEGNDGEGRGYDMRSSDKDKAMKLVKQGEVVGTAL